MVVPEKGADDKTIVLQEGAEGETIVVVPEGAEMKQLSYIKALKMNQLWSWQN